MLSSCLYCAISACVKYRYQFFVKSVIKLVCDNGSHVFVTMSDKISVNQKTFKLFHENFQTLKTCSNLHREEDSTHLFKNIRNTWVTRKTQPLRFYNPETLEEYTAGWKDLVKIYEHSQKVVQKQPPEVFCKKRCSLKFPKIHRKTPLTATALTTPAALLKKRLRHRYFPVNFAKFLRTTFLQNNFGRLLLVV